MMNPEIERKMIIGLVGSTEYYKKIRPEIKPELIITPVAKLLAMWCNEYFDKYQKAPGMGIAEIYYSKAKSGKIAKEVLEEIEEDLLPDLSDEWETYGIDVDTLVDSTKKYFKTNKLHAIKEGIELALEKDDIDTAEHLVQEYKSTTTVKDVVIMNNKEQLREAVHKAFSEVYEPLIWYPGALGEFWNDSMVRGGFVALLAPEKRGKTAMMIDAAVRAVRQKRKVAVFQAGDMSTSQQLRRLAIYLTKNSDREKYTGRLLLPQKDCFFNQSNNCDNLVRECDFGVFEDRGLSLNEARREITMDDLKEAFEADKEYQPCSNCLAFKKNQWGVPWLKEVNIKDTLQETQAISVLEEYFVKKNRNLRFSTHPNGSLTVQEMEQVLNSWESEDGFIPDIVILDYADLLAGRGNEERHKQNDNWKALRGLNQKINCLLITATQSDANSYERDTLSLKNFSEDKRKFAHVTAFYGLNQDAKGREKKIGMLRINELILREDGFDVNRQVTLLQGLAIGRPILTSYW